MQVIAQSDSVSLDFVKVVDEEAVGLAVPASTLVIEGLMDVAGLARDPDEIIPAIAEADYYTHFLWYRVEPEFSRIVVTDEVVRGRRAVDGFKKKAKEHEKAGRYLTYDFYKPLREITRVEKMDGHEIRTVLSILPPRGGGSGGAVPSCSVRVYFDGKLKVDCPIGYSHRDSLTVSKVIVHADEQMAEIVSFDPYESRIPLFNFFEHDARVVVLQGGKLVSKVVKPKQESRK